MNDTTINWKNDKSSSRRVHLSVRNEYIRVYMYLCRMHVRRKRLTNHTHTERYQRTAYRAEGFPSGNKFPARNRVSCPNKWSSPSVYATFSPMCILRRTLVP